MRKKIITVAATLLLLGLLSMVEQLSVERLTSEAMEKTRRFSFCWRRMNRNRDWRAHGRWTRGGTRKRRTRR